MTVASVTTVAPDPIQELLLECCSDKTASSPVIAEQSNDVAVPLWNDEAEMILRAKENIREFAPLYDRYVERIYRYVYRRVSDHDVAEDLTAQTFQQAMGALQSYEWRGVPFSAWLYRIAGNLIIRYRQTSGREVTMEYVERLIDQRGSFDDPLESIIQQSSSELLHRAVQRLSPDQQRALMLKYARGLKNQEVGLLMNRTEGGVKQLVHRAIIALRKSLRELEQQPSTVA